MTDGFGNIFWEINWISAQKYMFLCNDHIVYNKLEIYMFNNKSKEIVTYI